MRIPGSIAFTLATLGLFSQTSPAEETNKPQAAAQVQTLPKPSKEKTHGLQIDFKDGLTMPDILKALDGYTVHEILPVSPSRNIHYVRLGSVYNTPDLLFRLRRNKDIESAQISGSKPNIVTAADVAREVDEMLDAENKEYNLTFNFKNDISDEGAKRILESLKATNVKLVSAFSNTYNATIRTSLPLDEYYQLLREFNAFDNITQNIPKRSKF